MEQTSTDLEDQQTSEAVIPGQVWDELVYRLEDYNKIGSDSTYMRFYYYFRGVQDALELRPSQASALIGTLHQKVKPYETQESETKARKASSRR